MAEHIVGTQAAPGVLTDPLRNRGVAFTQAERVELGAELRRDQIDSYVNRSLMLVTALSPVIGYDKASTIAHKADEEGTTLREAALDSGSISAEDFDRIVNPAAMVRPAQRHE